MECATVTGGVKVCSDGIMWKSFGETFQMHGYYTRFCFSSFTGGKHAAVGDTGGRKRKFISGTESRFRILSGRWRLRVFGMMRMIISTVNEVSNSQKVLRSEFCLLPYHKLLRIPGLQAFGYGLPVLSD